MAFKKVLLLEMGQRDCCISDELAELPWVIIRLGCGKDVLNRLAGDFYELLVVNSLDADLASLFFLKQVMVAYPWLRVVLLLNGKMVVDDEFVKLGVICFCLPFDYRKIKQKLVCLLELESREMLGRDVRGVQQKLMVLQRFLHDMVDANSFSEALGGLGNVLAELVSAAVVGIMSVDGDSCNLGFTLRKNVGIEDLARIEEEVICQYELLCDFHLNRDGIRVEVNRNYADGDEECLVADKHILIPYTVNSSVHGNLVIVSEQGQEFSELDLNFLYFLPVYFTGIFETLEKMRRQALYDGLTQIYNRLYLDEALKNVVAHCKRNNNSAVLLMIDIDYFKRVNDSYGHQAGDQVLCEFASVLKRAARQSDIIGRYGGDEFVIILNYAGEKEGRIFVRRLLDMVRTSCFCEGKHDIHLTASMGVIAIPEHLQDNDTLSTIMKRLDDSLYRAKDEGRDNAQFCGQGLGGIYKEKSSLQKLEKKVGKVMLVDDEVSICNLLKKMLQRKGMEVDCYHLADDALERLSEDASYDLVITDINMPWKTGIELLQELHEKNNSMIKLVMTGMATIENTVNSMRHGAFDFIQKPISMQLFYATVDRALKYKRSIDQNILYQTRLEQLVEDKNQRLKESLSEVEKSYTFTLQAMVGMLDAREENSGKHSLRVKGMALQLARFLEMSSDDLWTIGQGALLHDIGKIAIPDNILLKPAKLSSEEWDIMRSHVEVGYNIISGSEWLRDVAEIVYCHHERFDGKGYPRGLAGEDICIGARIFAIVDTYDAMRSDRVYRRGCSMGEAVEEIVRCRGTQFDPRVVDIFCLHQEEMEDVFQRVIQEYN